jgi:hypothetical protein
MTWAVAWGITSFIWPVAGNDSPGAILSVGLVPDDQSLVDGCRRVTCAPILPIPHAAGDVGGQHRRESDTFKMLWEARETRAGYIYCDRLPLGALWPEECCLIDDTRLQLAVRGVQIRAGCLRFTQRPLDLAAGLGVAGFQTF